MSSHRDIALRTITEPNQIDDAHDRESLLVNTSHEHTLKKHQHTLSVWLDWVLSTWNDQPEFCFDWPFSHIKIFFRYLKHALWGLVILL